MPKETDVEENLDWVNARELCSIPRAAEVLLEEVHRDVNTRRQAIANRFQDRFQFAVEGNARRFTVMRDSHDGAYYSVEFSSRGDAIQISSNDADTLAGFSAVPRLN